MKHILEFNTKAFLLGASCSSKCCGMRHGSDATTKKKTEYLHLERKHISISCSSFPLINLDEANMYIQVKKKITEKFNPNKTHKNFQS